MKVHKIPDNNKTTETFKVPSLSEAGVYHTIKKHLTIAGTYVYKCDCIGYVTRAKTNPFFECRHILAVKEFESIENSKKT
jgi:hypothetical protein